MRNWGLFLPAIACALLISCASGTEGRQGDGAPTGADATTDARRPGGDIGSDPSTTSFCSGASAWESDRVRGRSCTGGGIQPVGTSRNGQYTWQAGPVAVYRSR